MRCVGQVVVEPVVAGTIGTGTNIISERHNRFPSGAERGIVRVDLVKPLNLGYVTGEIKFLEERKIQFL